MIRVVVAGIGGEPVARDGCGDDQGADLATALRDAGMEAVFAGSGLTPAQAAHSAVQEDAAAIAVWPGDEQAIAEVRDRLTADGAEDILVLPAETDPDSLAARVREWTGANHP